MATSPLAAARLVEKDPLNLSPKEFSAKLDELGKHHNNIMKLAAKVYSLGKTQRLQYPNGQTVGRKELRTLSSQYVKELKSLRRNYTAHGKKKKRARREGGSAGFKNPILVTDNMRTFFQSASLGTSNPHDPANAPPLNTQLQVGLSGITTRAIMTPLFNIYAHVNQMQKDPKNKQFLTATPQMNQYFQDTYVRLAARPQKYQKNKETGEPDLSKPIPKFDSNRFRYASIQSIVADNTIPASADKPQAAYLPVLTAEQGVILNAPETKARLEQEQVLVSGILEVYRYRKSGSKLPFDAWVAKERAKKARKY